MAGTNAVLTGTYDPSLVIVTIGNVILTGFADGDAIDAKRDEDAYTKRVGNDGGVARARNSNKTGIIEITALATSSVNDELADMFYLDSLVFDGTPVVPIMIADTSGRTVCFSSQSWLKKGPDIKLSKEVGDRKWIFDCADLVLLPGGNNI